MLIEEQILNPQEAMLFFSEPLPIYGTFYHSQTLPSNLLVLQNISNTADDELLLTKDFLYIKSANPSAMEDLKTIALAEIDDFHATTQSIQTATPNNTDIKTRIILKTIVAPFLQKDGGDIQLENIQNHTAYVRFLGKCNGCPYAQKTLKNRVEKNLIKYLPELQEAILV